MDEVFDRKLSGKSSENKKLFWKEVKRERERKKGNCVYENEKGWSSFK